MEFGGEHKIVCLEASVVSFFKTFPAITLPLLGFRGEHQHRGMRSATRMTIPAARKFQASCKCWLEVLPRLNVGLPYCPTEPQNATAVGTERLILALCHVEFMCKTHGKKGKNKVKRRGVINSDPDSPPSPSRAEEEIWLFLLPALGVTNLQRQQTPPWTTAPSTVRKRFPAE